MKKIIHGCDCCGNNINEETYVNCINIVKEIKIGKNKFKITIEEVRTKESLNEDICISCLEEDIQNINFDGITQNRLID